MRIAVIMSWLPSEGNWGGVGYQAHRLANIMVKRGHEVDVYTATSGPEDALYNIVRIASEAESRSRWFMTLLFPVRVARQDFSGYDVIHAHGDNQWIRTKVPVVRTFYGSALGEALSSRSLKRFVSQLWLYLCEWISAYRSTTCTAISKTTIRHMPKVSRIVPCGVDLEEFSPGEKSPQPSILFVGYLDGRKRGNLLVRIFGEGVRNRIPDAELWMVSQFGEPAPGIVWYGKPDTQVLIDLFRRAWVFCMPSTYEGFGVPYIEAMASGTPVVSSQNHGAFEVLAEGKYGHIVPDTDLGPTLVDLLTNADLRDSLAARGLVRAVDFSFESIAKQYEQILSSAVLRSSSAGRD